MGHLDEDIARESAVSETMDSLILEYYVNSADNLSYLKNNGIKACFEPAQFFSILPGLGVHFVITSEEQIISMIRLTYPILLGIRKVTPKDINLSQFIDYIAGFMHLFSDRLEKEVENIVLGSFKDGFSRAETLFSYEEYQFLRKECLQEFSDVVNYTNSCHLVETNDAPILFKSIPLPKTKVSDLDMIIFKTRCMANCKNPEVFLSAESEDYYMLLNPDAKPGTIEALRISGDNSYVSAELH